MKLTKQEIETLHSCLPFELEKLKSSNLCVLVVHRETKNVVSIQRFSFFRKALKKAPCLYDDFKTYCYILKVLC